MSDVRRDLDLAIAGFRDALAVHNHELADGWAALAFDLWEEANWSAIEEQFPSKAADPREDGPAAAKRDADRGTAT